MKENNDDDNNINNENIIINNKENSPIEINIHQNSIKNGNTLVPNPPSNNKPKIQIPNEITEQEIHAIIKFKEHCALSGLEYRFDLYNNDIILRLLRSRKYNILETYKAFIEFINFTKKYDAFNIRISLFPNMDKIRLFYPHGFHKTTITGEPVFIQMLGELKISDINRLLPEPLLTQYMIYKINEVNKIIFPKCSEKFGRKIDKVFCIIDLLGLTTSLMNKQIMDFVNKLTSVCSNYYPWIMDCMYFVNTSLVFKTIWAPCKYLYEYETRQRIFLLGFDYKKELLKKIDIQNLPKFFGGMCNCQPYGCIFSNVGPWNEQKTEGEKRREKNYLEKIETLKMEKNNIEDDEDEHFDE
jgi:hypothetical protein